MRMLCRWWKHAWHAYKSKPCTLELKPPPACCLACQVSPLIVPLFGPFGRAQVGDFVTCRRRPPVAYEQLKRWNPVKSRSVMMPMSTRCGLLLTAVQELARKQNVWV